MKKGFTLVELLCVIVIIAVISLITFPKVTSYINKTREDLYKTQVKDLQKSGEKWALDNIDYLDKYHINDICITLDLLKDFKYLEKDDILNPKDKTVMNGCILISYKDNKYSYEYKELDCTRDDLSTYSDSYIVYDSTEQGDDYIISKAENSVEHGPFYQNVLNNNELKVLGETTDGLYELDDEYVFRGNTVNNYVTYEGKTWRILSINKKDYSMKLINTTIDSAILSTEETNDFTKTTLIKDNLSVQVSNYAKILDSWNNGIVDKIDQNIDSIKNSIEQNSIVSRTGLISLYDYSIASLDDNCYNNIGTGSCANNNYLATMFSGKDFWTMTQNSEGKYWYVSSLNAISTIESTSGPYSYARVIKVPINIYCTNCDTATGSESNFAYELK